MYHFATALCTGIIATALVGVVPFTPTAAEAATTSTADKAALKEATVACKAEAKEKKISWPASRRFVSDCVAKTVKLTPAQLQEIAVNKRSSQARRKTREKRIGGPRAAN